MAINGISSGLSAIQRQAVAIDRAADKIARSTTSNVTEAPTNAQDAEALAAQESGLIDGNVEMIIAARMFTAAVKMAQTTNETILESLKLGGYEGAQAA